MVCIIKDQISKSKYQKEIVSLFHGSIVKNNQAIEQYSNCYTVIVCQTRLEMSAFNFFSSIAIRPARLHG